MSLIKNALSNLKGHKFRVFIVLIWIIIGITSVVLVSSIGNGLKEEVKTSINNVNPNKTRIYFEPSNYNMDEFSVFLTPFSKTDIETLSFIEGVERIGASSNGFDMSNTYSSNATFDKKNTYVDISPLKDDTDIKILYGRNFSLDDENRKVIIITMQNATELFSTPENTVGHGITIEGNIYEVIGILDESYAPDNDDTKNKYRMDYNYNMPTSYMPKKTFDNLTNQFNQPSEIYSLDLIASNGYDVYEVANKVIDKLYELHSDIEGSYNTEDPSMQSSELEYMTSSINKFIAIITLISLFVGGIGVMNIMYISVIERKREIGIRRAIGAKPRTILFQFLIESIFITFCGGILGIIVGFIVTNYVSNYLPFKAVLNLNSFLLATITTVLIGVIFGLIPAFKASRLDPIKAIYKQ